MKRALIADDSRMMAQYVESVLKRLGYRHIDIARDGRQALLLLEASRYHLVVLDHQMPELTGIELIREIRKTQPELQAPIMMMTSSPDQVMLQQIVVEALPVAALLVKPFTAGAFIAKHDQVIQRGRAPWNDPKQAVPAQQSGKEPAGRYEGSALIGHWSVETSLFLLKFQGLACHADRNVIKSCFDDAIAGNPTNVIIDMTEVTEFDAFYAGFLLAFCGTLANANRRALLITGGNPRVTGLGLDRLVITFPGRSEAVRYLGSA